MEKRVICYALLAILLLSLIVPNSRSADDGSWWNKSWSFKEEIKIPIDTKDDNAKYQPIDIPINFSNPCWAKNELEHSVRVILEKDGTFTELESQIYDLVYDQNYTENDHITSCNLVFIIPEEANGNEKYYVYYDDKIKPSPNYKKHVNVEESYYQYEPIQGMIFESSYYKITEEGYIVYGINKYGRFLDNLVSQQVTKLKKGSKEAMPINGDHIASFGFAYWWLKDGHWTGIYSSDKLISSKIFVNGNLMVKIGIVSESNDGTLRSTAIYKYYYCPSENKRLYTHVRDEVVKYPLPTGDEIDVGYVALRSGILKSSAINDLNFGEIPPYLHFYSDEERVSTQEIDQYPESNEQIIGKKDDCDLGSSPWVSVDYGESGKAHAVIFESNKILKSGNEKGDGIQLELDESKNIKYPGLEGRFADLYLLGNFYEKDGSFDNILPDNYVAEFNAEYFTTEDGGYPAVEKEASVYQKLISYQPGSEDKVENDNGTKEAYSLTVSAQLSPSLSWKLGLSALLLKNSYISAEVLNENGTVGYARMGRIPLNENLKIDWKNISLFLKARFTNIPSGKNVVKIWLENPLFNDEKEFIGYEIIDLQKNADVHVYCKPEGKISVSVLDQNKNGIENTQVYLIKDGTIIVKADTDQNGKAIIKAPCGLTETYTLKAIYKGFLVYSEDIRLGMIRRFIPLEKTISFNIYNLKINIRDSDGKAPSFNLNVDLTSDEMSNPIVISADNITDGTYNFKSLYQANYTLEIKYNHFEIKEKIRITSTDSISINLYDFIAYIKDSWGLQPDAILDVSLTSKDFEKNVVIPGDKLAADKYSFSELYTGNYTLKVTYKSFTITQPVNVLNNGEIQIEFPALFNVTTTVLDARGNPLKDAKVVMIRGEKEIDGITDIDGNVTLSIPPGVYVNKIYYNEELIAERKIDVLNEKTYSVVTSHQPMTPLIIIGLSITLLIGAAILSYRKKEGLFFLEMLAIILVIIAIFSPWWAISGLSASPHFETSTKLYFIPTKMVTITSNENVTAGELASLDNKFVSVIIPLTVAIGFGTLCVLTSIILNRYKKYRSSLLVFLIAIIILTVSIVAFFYAMSELANVMVGGFAGNGNLDINIPGENRYATIPCSWGPSFGFYLILGAIVILTFIFCLNLKRMILKRIKQ